jgi:hypothetical protein
MQNEHGIKCPVDWGDVDSKIEYIVTSPNGYLYGLSQKPILKDNGFMLHKYMQAYKVNFWDCQMNEPNFKPLGMHDFGELHDVSKHIWQRPKP